MRPIDADTLSKSINDGPGTSIQKFFADACVAAAPTLENFKPIAYAHWNFYNCCTHCGEEAIYFWERSKHIFTDYCPHCGAKMIKK